ncbi:helix-turn-helix transcriptional regulator [Bifidobacterium pullorum subsp. saeculare]|uniref:Helix-turn-helix transcriptional regulator n=1 Tax=Bifidobacterium pullorum subsp. saeculare TaxID=78257 RepID=A0A939B949_9BIFI|nr:helix-turn-helix transcriptional regulator [Bifidobacterium pullorum]MBM6699153.1 helix-turn-helix transcriptional regulator [Bifidobacterium pullorum subsp. saeculare]
MDSQELIRRLMDLTGMNAAQFAKATGLTESMVSRTLNGRNDPSFNKIAGAVERLGFSIAFTPISMGELEAAALRQARDGSPAVGASAD